MDVIIFAAQEIRDGFHGVAIRVDERHRLAEQMVHVGIDLRRGPTVEIQQREFFLQQPHQWRDRLGIQLELRSQRRIPAATGVVDVSLLHGFTQVNFERGIFQRQLGVVGGGLDFIETEIRATFFEPSEHAEEQ